jgi:hypothetical protein
MDNFGSSTPPRNDDLDKPIPFDDGLDAPAPAKEGPASSPPGVSRAPLNLGKAGPNPAAPSPTPTVQSPQAAARKPAAPAARPAVRPGARPVARPAARVTGCKTFFTKLHPGAIEFLDEQISNWLKDNPNISVKLTNVTVGEVQAKKTEPNILITVWY